MKTSDISCVINMLLTQKNCNSEPVSLSGTQVSKRQTAKEAKARSSEPIELHSAAVSRPQSPVPVRTVPGLFHEFHESCKMAPMLHLKRRALALPQTEETWTTSNWQEIQWLNLSINVKKNMTEFDFPNDNIEMNVWNLIVKGPTKGFDLRCLTCDPDTQAHVQNALSYVNYSRWHVMKSGSE